jgi:pyruvate dehydrogenase E2 component (dihydrolipoamide acetyltransferase)
MDQGTIVKWEKEEGDQLEDGDIIAQIETDKAVMDMETPATGYLAKIILPAGSRDIPLGQVLAVIVEEKDDIAAFKDFEATSSPAIETTPTSAPPPKDTTEEISPQSAANIGNT